MCIVLFPYPSLFPLWLTVVPFPRLEVIRKPDGLLLSLYRKGFCMWLICLWGPPILCAIDNWVHSWSSPCICCDRARFWFPNVLLPSTSSGCRRLVYQLEWLWKFSSSTYLVFLWFNWMKGCDFERVTICSRGLPLFLYTTNHCVLTTLS